MLLQNILLLIFFIFLVAIVCITGLYFVVFYSHKNEKIFKGQMFFQGVAIFGFCFPIIILTIPAFDYLYQKLNTVTLVVKPGEEMDIYQFSSKMPIMLYTAIFIYIFNIFSVDFYRSDKPNLRTKILLSLKRPSLILFVYLLAVFFFYSMEQVSPSLHALENATFTSSAGVETTVEN